MLLTSPLINNYTKLLLLDNNENNKETINSENCTSIYDKNINKTNDIYYEEIEKCIDEYYSDNDKNNENEHCLNIYNKNMNRIYNINNEDKEYCIRINNNSSIDELQK